MSLLEERIGYKPFNYPFAYEAWKTQQSIHWLADEVPLADDVKDWNTKLSKEEKNLLTHIFRFFTQADIEVNNCYMTHYASVFKPTEVKMMLAAFANMETVHIDAYSHLLDTVGMPEVEYSAFMKYKEMKDKYEYLHNIKSFKGAKWVKEMDTLEKLALFSAFTEGVSLFSSFAMLLNFTRQNKMKGMGQIIAWSIRDESVSKDTTILSKRGFIGINDITENDEVAQYDVETKQISFAKPKRINKYKRQGGMVKIKNRFIDSYITTSHDMLVSRWPDSYKKVHAEDINLKRWTMPTAGYATGTDDTLTDLERLLILLQADGSCTRDNGSWEIQVLKDRKIKLIENLLINFKHTKGIKSDGKNWYRVHVPEEYNEEIIKSLAFLEYSNYSALKCNSIIDWAINFDGSQRDSSVIYCNTNKKAIDKLQIIATLGGLSTNICKTIDNRKESYKDYYRLSIKENDYRTGTNKDITIDNEYEDDCWCVTMPKGTIVTKYNDSILITGNTLHCDSMIKLFLTLLKESKLDDEQKELIHERILNIAEEIVRQEDAFIDLAFESGGIEGLGDDDMKQYIRYIADRRLLQMKYKTHFKVKKNPLPWLEEILNGKEHGNFFETRVTEYSKSATTGAWEESFDFLDQAG